MKGKKTYAGLLIALLGMLGLGDTISEEQAGQIINLTLNLGGILFAAYGRYKAKP